MLIDDLAHDLRYAARVLRRAPGFTVGAALTLMLGIGATTAVFSVIDAALLRGLPYGDVDRLVWVIERSDDGQVRAPSYPTFRDWKEMSTASNAIVDLAFVRGVGTWLEGPEGSERVLVGNVSPGFFQLMKTRPLLGRTFLPEEERQGAGVVVLSFGAWRRYFGGDKGIVGRAIRLDGVPTTVIGVMPRGFVYPEWVPGPRGRTGMWAPIARIERTDIGLSKRGVRADSRVVARLRQADDSARAAASLAVIQSRLAAQYPAESKGWNHVALVRLRDVVVGDATRLLMTLASAVALVLLLACVNVANLWLVRGVSRSREFAVRSALGAGRWRVVRQLLTEGVAVALLGGAAGAVLAAMIVAATRARAATELPRADEGIVDVRVLGVALALTLAVAVASSIVPALRATRRSDGDVIRSGAHAAIGGRGDSRMRDALVVAQLALALMLLVGTGLLVQSLRRVTAVPLGFNPDGVVVGSIEPPAKYGRPEQAAELYGRLLDRVRAVPGVRDVAIVNHAPLGTGWVPTTVRRPGADRGGTAGDGPGPLYRTVSESYLRVMQMRMAAGRWLTSDDMRARERFVINETLAKQLFPDRTAVGQQLIVQRASQARADFGQPVTGTIVGVVRDIRQFDQENPPSPEIFVPYTLEVWPWVTLVVRADNAGRTIPLVRQAVREVEPTIPVAASTAFGGFGPMTDRLSSTTARRRLVLSAIGAFAAAALLLAAVGMYSVISYGVSQRRREVAVRLALGATGGGIARLIVREGLQLAALGTALGLAGAYGATRLIRSMLFATGVADTGAYVLTAAILLVTAALASGLPALRAARLSPMEAMRDV
jgi:putative ABC transport system permease protein